MKKLLLVLLLGMGSCSAAIAIQSRQETEPINGTDCKKAGATGVSDSWNKSVPMICEPQYGDEYLEWTIDEERIAEVYGMTVDDFLNEGSRKCPNSNAWRC